MDYNFCINEVTTSLYTKSITINTSFDIDPESVNDSTIKFNEFSSKNLVDYKLEVEGKSIILTLLDWPKPNQEYLLIVNGIKNILGNDLQSGTKRKITFESGITSNISLIHPSYDEVISDLRLEWEEKLVDESAQLVNSYYLEIATENAFNNIIRNTKVQNANTINLADINNGQYYVRIRAEKLNEYGPWSEVSTFIVDSVSNNTIPEPELNQEYDQIYVPEIGIELKPENGTTPTSFIIRFNREIDPNSINNIVVRKSDVK